jgi:hypothetical protein
MEIFTQQEVDAARYMYRIAPPGSVLVAAAPGLAIKFQDYEQYKYRPASRDIFVNKLNVIMHLMKDPQYPGAFLILTRSQKAYTELYSKLPAGSWQKFRQELDASGKFERIFANDDAEIFILAGRAVRSETQP